jgi:hypothetical protein
MLYLIVTINLQEGFRPTERFAREYVYQCAIYGVFMLLKRLYTEGSLFDKNWNAECCLLSMTQVEKRSQPFNAYYFFLIYKILIAKYLND